MGLSYDWRRELATCEPEYYRHEQKMFLDFLEAGLAYKRDPGQLGSGREYGPRERASHRWPRLAIGCLGRTAQSTAVVLAHYGLRRRLVGNARDHGPVAGSGLVDAKELDQPVRRRADSRSNFPVATIGLKSLRHGPTPYLGQALRGRRKSPIGPRTRGERSGVAGFY